MDRQYKELLQHILDSNHVDQIRSDRTGVGTLSVFGYQMRFDLSEGFPAQTTKKLAWKSTVSELLWFLEGSTDERRLAELTFCKDRVDLKNKTTIWSANADKQAKELGYRNDHQLKYLGPVYGEQWRKFVGYNQRTNKIDQVDQIKTIIDQIKNDPKSRRIILNSWNAVDIPTMSLPPCHVMSQFYVKDGKLSCLMTQRSCDVFLGLPFNVASYALLTHMLARHCALDVGELIISLGDAHIYSNHIDQVREVLDREEFELPTLMIDADFDLDVTLENYWGCFELDTNKMFTLKNYKHHGAIKADMAV